MFRLTHQLQGAIASAVDFAVTVNATCALAGNLFPT
jgi:hypothetical protein